MDWNVQLNLTFILGPRRFWWFLMALKKVVRLSKRKLISLSNLFLNVIDFFTIWRENTPAMAIHKTALIDPSAKIDPTSEIGPNVVIEEEVVIGPNNKIWQNATICKFTSLGERNEVHMGAVIGHVPQDLAFKGEPTTTRIGNKNIFREYATIHRGTAPGSATVIGDKNFFMAHSHAGHNCQIGNETIIAMGALLAGHVEVGDQAFVSGNCAVHQFTRIGKLAMMSGNSGVSKDIPPFMVEDGINLIAAINTVGLRRAGFSLSTRKAIKHAYEILYRSDLSVSNAIEQLTQLAPNEQVQCLIDFVRNSKRGICRHRRIGDPGRRTQSAQETTALFEA